MTKYILLSAGVGLLGFAAGELFIWPAVSWVRLILPCGLIWAGAGLLHRQIMSGRFFRRPERARQAYYDVRRILSQQGKS